jgi:hypothetical protein
MRKRLRVLDERLGILGFYHEKDFSINIEFGIIGWV